MVTPSTPTALAPNSPTEAQISEETVVEPEETTATTTVEPEAPTPPTSVAEAPETSPPPQEPLPRAPAPSPPLQPQPAQLSDLMRQYQEGQQRQAEIEERYENGLDAQAVQQFRAQMEAQYPAVDMSRVVAQYEQMVKQSRQLQRQMRQQEQQYQQVVQNHQAKVIVAQRFSDQYGMPFGELMKFDSPQLMEANARAWKAEQELTRTKQASITPTRPTNGTPSRARVSVTPDNIDKLHMEGKVSDAQYRRFLESGAL